MKTSLAYLKRRTVAVLCWSIQIFVALMLCTPIPVTIRDARQAERDGDRFKSRTRYTVAVLHGAVALLLLSLWLHIWCRARQERRAALAELNQLHAAMISEINDMLRRAREEQWPDEVIQQIVDKREEIAERHRRFLAERT